MRKVCDAVEETCEKYESDRTAGYYVDSAGAPVSDEVDKKPTSPPAEEDDGVEVATDEEEEEAAPEEIKDEWGGALVNTSFSSLTTIKQGSQNRDEPVGFPRRLPQPRQAVIHPDKPKHYGTRSLGYSLFTPGGGLPKSEITPLSLFALQHICQN